MADLVPTCPACGLPHVTSYGHQSCAKHKTKRDDTGRLVPCSNPPVSGADACRYHGASAPQVRAAAAGRVEEQAARRELARLGQKIVIDPGQALLDLVYWTAGEVEFWRERVVELADADPKALVWGKAAKVHKSSGQFPGTDTTFHAEPPVAYRMLVDASNRLASYSSAALKAGVDERRVRIEESQGAVVVGAIQRILDGLYQALIAAGITPDVLETAWRAAIADVVPRELRAAALGGAA